MHTWVSEVFTHLYPFVDLQDLQNKHTGFEVCRGAEVVRTNRFFGRPFNSKTEKAGAFIWCGIEPGRVRDFTERIKDLRN